MSQQLQFILLGSSGVGKTSLLERWTHPSAPPDPFETIGINVLSCAVHVGNTLYATKFWDTSGKEYYERLLLSYVFNADAVMLVFDTSSVVSWIKVDYWLEKIEKTNGVQYPVVLIGNKIDKESKRVVYKQEIKAYVNSHVMQNIVYCETSALTGDGVLDAYHLAVNFAKKKPVRNIYTANSFRGESKCIIV